MNFFELVGMITTAYFLAGLCVAVWYFGFHDTEERAELLRYTGKGEWGFVVPAMFLWIVLWPISMFWDKR